MNNNEIIKFQNIRFFKHPDYTNYLSSKCGQILSLKRKEKKILKLGVDSSGYLFFVLYENNTQKHYLVSRHVYECFKGNILDDKVVDHINNDKKNNNIDNLQLLSPKENIRKSGKNEEQLPQPTVGRLSANSRPTVGQQPADSWPTVGRLLANCRLPPFTKIFCQKSADCWQHVGNLLAKCRLTVGRQSADWLRAPVKYQKSLSSQGGTLHIDAK